MRFRLAHSLAIAAVLAACGKDESPSHEPEPSPDALSEDADASEPSPSPEPSPAPEPTPDPIAEPVDAAPDTGEPDAGEPDAGEPDAGEPDTAQPDAGEPDAGEPDAAGPDAGEPDAAQPDAAEPDAAQPDAAEPDAAQPDAAQPDAGEPDAAEPDAGPDPEPACASACDCAQGQGCVEGVCALGTTPVLCCTGAGCTDGSPCQDEAGGSGICGAEQSLYAGIVQVNEVLSDGTVDGDPNGDGEPQNGVDDEFVEVLNLGESLVDLSGWTIFEKDLAATPRHTFPEGTMLLPGGAIVVFGGGTAPDDTPTAIFQVADGGLPGLTLGLALDNEGDALRLYDEDGKLVAVFHYGPGATLPALSDESWTRSPDGKGAWTPHTTAAGDPEIRFSPGLKADLSSF